MCWHCKIGLSGASARQQAPLGPDQLRGFSFTNSRTRLIMKITVDTPHFNVRVYNDSEAMLYSYTATDIHLYADIEHLLSAVQEMVVTKIADLGSFGDTE